MKVSALLRIEGYEMVADFNFPGETQLEAELYVKARIDEFNNSLRDNESIREFICIKQMFKYVDMTDVELKDAYLKEFKQFPYKISKFSMDPLWGEDVKQIIRYYRKNLSKGRLWLCDYIHTIATVMQPAELMNIIGEIVKRGWKRLPKG